MRRIVSLAVVLATFAACAKDAASPSSPQNARGTYIGNDKAGSITVAVITLVVTPPDSTETPVPGARVSVVRWGAIPPDSSGGASPLMAADSVAPSPEPIPSSVTCGRSAPPTASAVTGPDGMAVIGNLQSGWYDVQVAPPAGAPYRGGIFCGVPLRDGRGSDVKVVMFP